MSTSPLKIDPKKLDIRKSISFLDWFDIIVFEPAPGHLSVDFVCKEKGKQVTIDTKTKEQLNREITSRAYGMSTKDPKTIGYIKEFVGRLMLGYHDNNLAIIEDIPKAIEDHYSHLRNIKQHNN